MNICIGGPWNGAKLLGKSQKKDSFIVKDRQTNLITTYYKHKIKSKNEILIFWISEDLIEQDTYELIKLYL